MAFCPTTYSLLKVLWWNLLGQYMYYLFTKVFSRVTPIVHNILKHLLPRFSNTAPEWFTCGWAWAALWSNNLDAGGLPNTAFVLYFRRVAKERFEDWINNAASEASAVINTAIRGLLGSLLHGYTTFSNWIESIRNIVGTWVPSWTSTLAAGLTLLFDWLPSDITSGLVSFYDKFIAWYEVTKSWVRTNYDTARNWVANIAPALTRGYITIRAWYDIVATWVTNFRNDPYGTVAGWLGAAWTTWLELDYHMVSFYNAIWVPYRITLHDFLADPLGWVYDRVEDELIRRW